LLHRPTIAGAASPEDGVDVLREDFVAPVSREVEALDPHPAIVNVSRATRSDREAKDTFGRDTSTPGRMLLPAEWERQCPPVAGRRRPSSRT
jgi:hypothetical protein